MANSEIIAVSFIAFTPMVAVESAHAPVELDQEQKPREQLLFLIGETTVKLRHDVAAIAVLLDFLLDQDLSSTGFDHSLRV